MLCSEFGTDNRHGRAHVDCLSSRYLTIESACGWWLRHESRHYVGYASNKPIYSPGSFDTANLLTSHLYCTLEDGQHHVFPSTHAKDNGAGSRYLGVCTPSSHIPAHSLIIIPSASLKLQRDKIRQYQVKVDYLLLRLEGCVCHFGCLDSGGARSRARGRQGMPQGRSERTCCHRLATAEISRIESRQDGCATRDIGRPGSRCFLYVF